MDIVQGLTAANLALGLVKDLRAIDRSVDEAAFKLKIAELLEALADAKIALSEAKAALAEKDGQIIDLRKQIDTMTSGENCPICSSGRMKVVKSVRDPAFGVFGVQQRTLECDNSDCGHSETRQFDPGSRK